MDFKLRFKDVTIFYQIIENKGKPNLCLLHPYSSNSSLFEQLIITLKKDFNIVLIDLPGHGLSQVSSSVGFKDMPEIIKAIFDQHNVINAHFLGVYDGAIIAQAFAEIYKDKLVSLTALSGYSIYHDSHIVIKQEYFKDRLKNAFKWLFNFKLYKQYYIDKAAYTDQGKIRYEKSMRGFSRKSIKALKGFNRFNQLKPETKPYPTYLICGEFEDDVIKDACMLYEQKRTKTVLEGYKQSKRVVFLDQYRLFQEHFITFLKNLS